MYSLRISPAFKKSYKKLSAVDRNSVDGKLVLLASNPWHPSLRVKKIVTTPFYECSVNMDIRIAFEFDGDELIVLLDIGHHDDLLNRAKRKG